MLAGWLCTPGSPGNIGTATGQPRQHRHPQATESVTGQPSQPQLWLRRLSCGYLGACGCHGGPGSQHERPVSKWSVRPRVASRGSSSDRDTTLRAVGCASKSLHAVGSQDERPGSKRDGQTVRQTVRHSPFNGMGDKWAPHGVAPCRKG